MNFREAINETVKQAQEENRVCYLYKNRIGNFRWGVSAQYWDDWLFKAYPGGRRVLSVEGTKVLDALEPQNNGLQADGHYASVGELIETELLDAPKPYIWLGK